MKTTRAQRRAARERAHWQHRVAQAAGDPAALANVAWDLLRKTIKSLPLTDQAAAWNKVTGTLDQLRTKISGKGDPP